MRRLLVGLVLAAAVLGGTFGGIAAYAGMWPPFFILGSGSMQHSNTTSELGLLDTGDIAVVQAVRSREGVNTYLRGRATGYSSFGDFGDVLVFRDPEPNVTETIVHRAFTFVSRNASGGYDVPELGFLPRTSWTAIAYDGSVADAPYALRSFTVLDMGWRRDAAIEWNLTSLGTNYTTDGFLTFGDNNLYWPSKKTDPWILDPALVIARVRGEIPWIGLLRLTLLKSPEGCCASWGTTDPEVGAPANSWAALTSLLVASVALPVGLYLAWNPAARAAVLRLLSVKRPRSRRSNPEGSIARDDGANVAPPSPTNPQRSPAWNFEEWTRTVDERIRKLRF